MKQSRARGRNAIGLLVSLGILSCESSSGPASERRELSAPAPLSDVSATESESQLKGVAGALLVVDEQGSRSRDLQALLRELSPRRIETSDPYYKKSKRFLAVPLASLLALLWPDLKNHEARLHTPEASARLPEIQLHASDGYLVRLAADLAFHPSAYIAFADVDHPPFEPIGEQKANPAPLYLIWEGKAFPNLETHPRPWSIVRVTRLKGGSGLEHLQPTAGFGSDRAAQAGYVLFNQDCLRCHSINQQGGRVGPDLNVPQNILEYRPLEQVRAYIKDPRTFRYGTMPAHPHLSEQNLDEIVAYLRLMKDSKFDPHVASAP